MLKQHTNKMKNFYERIYILPTNECVVGQY